MATPKDMIRFVAALWEEERDDTEVAWKDVLLMPWRV